MIRLLAIACVVTLSTAPASANEWAATNEPIDWGERATIHFSFDVKDTRFEVVAKHRPADRKVSATSKELAPLKAVAKASAGSWKRGDKNPALEKALRAAFPDAKFSSLIVKWAIDKQFMINAAISEWKVTPKLRVSFEHVGGVVSHHGDFLEIQLYGGCTIPGHEFTSCEVRYSARVE